MPDFYAPDFDVRVNGVTLSAELRGQIVEVSYDNHQDAADMFTIRLNDPGTRLVDSPLFSVGNTVEIAMGYAGAGDLTSMMLGEITALTPSFPSSGQPMLTVTGYDKSHRLRHNSPGRLTYKMMNDSLIAAQIALENLLIPVVDPSPFPPRASVQQTGSDWALLQMLADRNSFRVSVAGDKLFFRLPRPQTERVVLEWGRNLSTFSPRLSTSGQAGLQVIRSYNPDMAQTIVAILPAVAAGADFEEIFNRAGNDFINQLVTLGRKVIHGQTPDTFVDAALLAKSILRQLLEGLFEGSGTTIGNPALRAGDQVNIQGVGKRFSGVYTLRQVTHSISDQGYSVDFEVTQKYTSTLLESLRTKVAEAPPPNRQELMRGIVYGRVINNVDPLDLGRVQVTLPHLSDDNLSDYVPVVTPFAGGSAGAFFQPGVGETVVVAFEQGDINRPVVLGSYWGVGLPSASGFVKKLKTKSGHAITLDDTPFAGKVQISDASGSTITLGPGGKVRVEAAGVLELAGKSIEISADTLIHIKAADVKVKVDNAMDVS
jgi:phage protein D